MRTQRGPIALYGASGYTGRLVAAELAAAGADFVLAGRNREKLEALAEQTGRVAAVQAVELEDRAGLNALLADCGAVIDCAGPFTLYGEPVLQAAIETGTHYLDTTGEQGYMDKVFRRYGADFERRRIAALPAMGFDYVPGDLLASLTAKGMGKLEEISLSYAWVGFTPTRGTARSALEIAQGGGVEYRDGAWRPARGSIGRGRTDFGEPVGEQRMIRYPAGEQITVPRHVDTANVRTAFTAASIVSAPGMGPLVPYLLRPFGLAMRTPIRRALAAAISRLPEGPSEKSRQAARFKIVCEARSESESRRGEISGRDVYGLTAAAVTRGAMLVCKRGFRGRGALAPSQAFDPADFLDSLRRFDVAWTIGDAERPSREPVAAGVA